MTCITHTTHKYSTSSSPSPVRMRFSTIVDTLLQNPCILDWGNNSSTCAYIICTHTDARKRLHHYTYNINHTQILLMGYCIVIAHCNKSGSFVLALRMAVMNVLCSWRPLAICICCVWYSVLLVHLQMV